MDAGDVVSSTIAAVSLVVAVSVAYRQARMQARLTAIEAQRRREEREAVEARHHANVSATVAGTPTALQLVLANDGPAVAQELWATVLPVGSDDPPLVHGLKELEQVPAVLRPGDLGDPGQPRQRWRRRPSASRSCCRGRTRPARTASRSRCGCRRHGRRPCHGGAEAGAGRQGAVRPRMRLEWTDHALGRWHVVEAEYKRNARGKVVETTIAEVEAGMRARGSAAAVTGARPAG